MFGKKNESIALQLVISLIKEKYGINEGHIKGRISGNTDEVSIVLLNGASGADSLEVDKCNRRPVELLQAHNGVLTKEAHEHHSYWSYSVITLNNNHLHDIIESLNLLPAAEAPVHRSMARC